MTEASLNSQQMWVPYDTPKDCSQGFCSIYCPQWCYIIFPPPPPLAFDNDTDVSSTTTTAFSPLVIAIIGVLASAFLLVSYYTIISKYCGAGTGTLSAIRRRLRRNSAADTETVEVSPSLRREHEHEDEPVWHVIPSNGLEQTLINKITLYRYKSSDGVVDGRDCSVCLSEFREDESLRLLPKCSHAFHLWCIDTWLRSHSNCPLCRANIVSVPVPVPELETAIEPVVVVVVQDSEDDATVADDDNGGSKDMIETEDFQVVRRSFSMGSSSHSIADVLRTSMEDELSAARDRGLFVQSSSSRRAGGELSKGDGRSRSLHCVMSPVAMKRSFSSGRFCFARGRSSNSILPM